MNNRQSIQEFLLGDSVKITSILSIATATTATITIKDPGLTVKVNAANMTKSTDKVYTYIYQSASTDVCGDYIATITITYGGYTSVYQSKFSMKEQE